MSSAGSSTEQGPPATAANSSRTRFGQPTTRSEARSSPNCTRSQSGLSSTGSSSATAHHCQTSKASPPPRNRARSSCSRGTPHERSYSATAINNSVAKGRATPSSSTQAASLCLSTATRAQHGRYSTTESSNSGDRRTTSNAQPPRCAPTATGQNLSRDESKTAPTEPKKSVRRGCLFLGGFELFPERNSTHGWQARQPLRSSPRGS